MFRAQLAACLLPPVLGLGLLACGGNEALRPRDPMERDAVADAVIAAMRGTVDEDTFVAKLAELASTGSSCAVPTLHAALWSSSERVRAAAEDGRKRWLELHPEGIPFGASVLRREPWADPSTPVPEAVLRKRRSFCRNLENEVAPPMYPRPLQN